MNAQLPPRGPDDPDELPDDAELKALYHRLPPSEPSPALDAAVLRAAATAVDPPVASRRPRWPLALATAATVVLAGGIAWRMRTEPAASLSQPASSAARVAPSATAVTAASTRELTAGSSAPMQDKASAMTRQAAPSLADHPQAAKREIGALKVASEATHAPAPHRSAPARLMLAPPPPPAPMAPVQPPTSPLAEEPPAPPPPPAPPAPPSYVPLAAPAPIADSAADRAVARETVSSASAREIARIRRLFERGETTQALAALKAFQQAHPGQSLPPDLRDRLGKP